MVEATRRRALWLVGVTTSCYVLALALLGIAAIIQQGGSAGGLIRAGLSFLALGMTASALVRLVLLVADHRGRAIWWTDATRTSRVLRVGGLVVRFGLAGVVWYLVSASGGR